MNTFITMTAGYGDNVYEFAFRFITAEEEDEFASEFSAVTMAGKGFTARLETLEKHLANALTEPVKQNGDKVADTIPESLKVIKQKLASEYGTDAAYERLLMQVFYSFRQRLAPTVTFR
jgi:hypothetical protein